MERVPAACPALRSGGCSEVCCGEIRDHKKNRRDKVNEEMGRKIGGGMKGVK